MSKGNPHRCSGLVNSPRALAKAAAATLACGVSLSALGTAGAAGAGTGAGADWWRHFEFLGLHFSHLGTWITTPGTVFNTALLASGTLLVRSAWLNRHTTGTPSALSSALSGASLALAGLIPITLDRTTHDLAARGIILGFAGALIFGAIHNKTLWGRAAGITLALALGMAAFLTGTINLTALETLAFACITWWAIKSTPEN